MHTSKTDVKKEDEDFIEAVIEFQEEFCRFCKQMEVLDYIIDVRKFHTDKKEHIITVDFDIEKNTFDKERRIHTFQMKTWEDVQRVIWELEDITNQIWWDNNELE